jgi:hypothetical protein
MLRRKVYGYRLQLEESFIFAIGRNAQILHHMTADNSAPPLPAEEWCRTFVLAIYQLAAGNAGHLHVNGWAIRAQRKHGHRNPVEVAHEEWTAQGK